MTFPRSQHRYHSSGVSRNVVSPSAMYVHRLGDLFANDPLCRSLRDFPGPVSSKSWKQIMKYMDTKIEEDRFQSSDHALLWRILKGWCENDGYIWGTR